MSIKISLAERCKELELEHGGVRAAAAAIGLDPAYFVRMRDGYKNNPSAETLKRMKLERCVYYVTTDRGW